MRWGSCSLYLWVVFLVIFWGPSLSSQLDAIAIMSFVMCKKITKRNNN